MVDLLLASGADPSVRQSHALWWAVYSKNTDIVGKLLAAGASAVASRGAIARQAVKSGSKDVIRQLLAAGADSVLTPYEKLEARALAGDTAHVERLAVNATQDQMGNMLARAARTQDEGMVATLVGLGANIHVSEEQALFNALVVNNEPITAKLMAAGASWESAWARLEKPARAAVAPMLKRHPAWAPTARQPDSARKTAGKSAPRRCPR